MYCVLAIGIVEFPCCSSRGRVKNFTKNYECLTTIRMLLRYSETVNCGIHNRAVAGAIIRAVKACLPDEFFQN